MPEAPPSPPLWLRAGDVELRPFDPSLAQTVLEIRNHETVRRNMRDSSPIAPESHHRWLRENVIEHRRVHLFAALEHEVPVGIALLRDFREDGAEVGLMVVDAGRRPLVCYAAAVLLGHYAFENAGLARLLSLVPRHNTHALAFNQGFGFDLQEPDDDPVYHRLVLARERFRSHPTHRRFSEKHGPRASAPA
jgi:RimJ/RimL family protein N-acetyltransferase